MRYFSYRSKMRLRSLTVTITVVVLCVIALAVGIFLYLQRFIVYTPTGAYLDMNRTQPTGETPLNPDFVVETPPPDADIVVETPVETPENAVARRKLSGVYVSGAMLADPAGLETALATTGKQLDVMVDVKSVFGNFFYSSGLPNAEPSSAVDPTRVDQFLQTLSQRSDIYLIARVPAFRDSAFALRNQDCGLPLQSGALWMDDQSCYWLDPANDRVVAYLESIALELAALGFDEVAFSDFYFPTSANIAYKGDSAAAVAEAARRLSFNLSGSGLSVSFFSGNASVAPYASHIFVESTDGAEVDPLVTALTGKLEDVASGLVFLTDSHDTRFAEYGILTPAIGAD